MGLKYEKNNQKKNTKRQKLKSDQNGIEIENKGHGGFQITLKVKIRPKWD